MINGALFVQSTVGAGGTGVTGSFVQIQKDGVEQGYNTDSPPVQFDEKNSPNHAFQLSSVAEVNNGGTLYYEFLLDINQSNSLFTAPGELLSLDQLRLYVSPTNINTSANKFANGYNAATGTLGGLSPSYDMNPGLTSTNFVELNGALTPGSGTINMTLFVPVSALGTNPNSFIYLYSQFGGHTFTSDQGNTGGAANDGFEQWANTTVGRPAITTTPGGTVEVNKSSTPMNDSATLAGGVNPTGTITFQLFAPNNPTAVYTDVVTLTGAATPVTFNTSTAGNNPGGFTPTATGTYQWVVSYSGDISNSPAGSPSGAEPQNAVDATISITPPTAVNEINHAETFTITVTASPAGTGTPNFAVPTVTFPTGTPGTAGGPTLVSIVGNVATYTETINSPTPGAFTIQASAMVTMGGLTVTRTTGDGISGDSPSAVKTYVDAFITIGPDGENLVNQQHTFTVTVEENTGTGLGYVPAANAPVTVTLTNVNGAVANPAGPFTLTTNSSGQATVTFTSATAGEVIGNATTTLVVNGVTLTRATGDGVSQDSPPADKFFGALSTTPGPTVALQSNTPLNDSATLEATNPTGTITFNLFAPDGTTLLYTNVVTLTGAAGPVTVTTATMGNNPGGFVPTTATGAGTYHWVVTFSGDLHNPRITSPAIAEPENVVDANISISPLTMDNLVNVPETFTITVTAFPAATGMPTFAVPLINFLTGTPGTVGPVTPVMAPTPQPDRTWLASWTVTINSAVTGVFTVQARDTVTMDSVPVVRTTGDGLSGDSPSAVKSYVPLTPADLVLTKTVDNPTPIFGTSVTYTLTVTNLGPGEATGVLLADTTPPGLNFVSATPSQGTLTRLPPGPLMWDVGTLANGAGAVLKVTAMTAAVGLLVNNAGVGADQPDPTPADNLAQAPITVFRSPGQISKAFFLASTILDPPADPSGSAGTPAASTVAPLNATLPFTENFTTVGDRPELNPYWTDQRGAMIGVNDQPIGVGDFNLSTLNGLSEANAVVTAGVNLGAGQTAGLVARYGGPGYSNFYLGQLRAIGNGQFQAAIFANIGGTFTTLAVGSTVNSGTGTLEFEVVGSSLKLLLNNQLVAYAQDTSITAPGSVGMRLSQGANVSSFSANKITASTSATLPFIANFTSTGAGSQLSTNWSDQLGNVTVVNGLATGQGAFNLSTVNGLNIGNAKVTADVSVNPGGNAGLVARYTGPLYNNFYLGQLRALGNGQFQGAIFKNIGGVFATIAVGSTTAATGTGALEFEVVGSSLKLFFNNRLLAYGFDTSLTAAAGGSAGIRLGQGAATSSFSADQVAVPTSQTLPFMDGFAGAGDGSQLSTTWSDQNGNIAVANGAAVGTGDFNLSTVNGINMGDVTVAGDINLTPGAGQSAGLVARYTGPLYSNFYLAQLRDIGNGQYQAAIFKNIGGTFSLVTLGSTTTKNAGRLLFKLKGSALELDLDNTMLASVVDTSITGPGSVGMRLSMNATIQNFSASR